jgi:hypothetical protein
MRASAVLLAILIVCLVSCKKEQNENPLKGRWVRLDNPTDTLSFGEMFSERLFVLERGSEIRDENLLPLAGSGPYQFVIKKDSIDILPAWSSSIISRRYYFKVNGNKIEIGDFIDNTKSTLCFSKL